MHVAQHCIHCCFPSSSGYREQGLPQDVWEASLLPDCSQDQLEKKFETKKKKTTYVKPGSDVRQNPGRREGGREGVSADVEIIRSLKWGEGICQLLCKENIWTLPVDRLATGHELNTWSWHTKCYRLKLDSLRNCGRKKKKEMFLLCCVV